MSTRSRSESVSSSSSESSTASSTDDSAQLLAAAKQAAEQQELGDRLATQDDTISLSAPAPVASTSRTTISQPSKADLLSSQRASTSKDKLPQDTFGTLPRKHLSKKTYNASQPQDAGNRWFHMPAAPAQPSEELKREVAALKLSAAIDPKRFLRGEAKRDMGRLPEHFHMGHVLPSDHPASSERKGHGQRGKKRSLVDEVAQDQQIRDYTKRKYNEVQTKSTSGGKNFYKAKQNKRSGGVKRK